MIPRPVFEQSILSFFAPVAEFLEDPTVTEVMINGPNHVFVERKGRIERTNVRFPNQEALLAALRNLAQYVGRHISEERPILEAHLPDGSRVEAVLPPVSPDGPHVAIRRFFRQALTMGKLVELGALTEEASRLLAGLVNGKQNVIVAGGTGSGKTSFLNALSAFVDPTERIVIIEDTRELQLQQPHVVQLEARAADARGKGAVSIRDLFRATLRLRPDRIVVGEVRGPEALDMVQAMISGHGGCLSTVHATYPIDALNRLETMALMSDVSLPLSALRAQLGSAVNFICQTSRNRDGSRGVTHVTEVVGYEESGYKLQDIFVRKPVGRDGRGRPVMTLVPTGARPRCQEMLEAIGAFDNAPGGPR